MTAAPPDTPDADPAHSPLNRPQDQTRAEDRARPHPGRHGPYSGPQRHSRRRHFRDLSSVGKWQARAHARRPEPGRFVHPQLAELVPAGHQPVLDRAGALDRFTHLPETAWLRSDSHATRWAVWQALIDHLNPETGLAVVGQHRLAERASHHRGRRVAPSTAGNHIRALADQDAIAYEPGASKEALGSSRDRASVYVILAPDIEDLAEQDVPLTPEQQTEVDRIAADLDLAAQRSGTVDELGHLPGGSAPTRREVITQPRKDPHFPSSTTTSPSQSDITPANPPSVLGSLPGETTGPARHEHPERFQPRTGPEREIAVAWIAAVMGWTGKTSRFAALRIERELRKITSPWFAAGWSPAAIVRAFRVLPDGTPWPGPLPIPNQRDSADQPRVRNLWALLTHRLAVWRDPLGHPIGPPFPTERPRRGRPRTVAAGPPTPPVPPPRAARVDAELAAWRARNDQQRAEQAALQAARQARQRQLSTSGDRRDAERPDPGLTGVYLRAQIERRGCN
jgi:hypothetical protein